MTNAKDKKPTKPDLSGFTDKDLDLPPSWEFEQQGDWVSGTVSQFRNVTAKDRRGNMRETRVMILDTMDGDVAVWETAQLTELFNDLNRGDEVYLEYDGKQTLENGNTMNKFICKVRYG